jgi:hypothetical protein
MTKHGSRAASIELNIEVVILPVSEIDTWLLQERGFGEGSSRRLEKSRCAPS